MSNELLLGFDLEDINMMLPARTHMASRVDMNVQRILNWLNTQKIRATFFTVGQLAIKFPSLIREIVDEGHEIACHSFSHMTLDRFNKETFKRDLDLNCEALYAAGSSAITGFRAPVFSMTEKTSWVYDVLKSSGFLYSSSVLPSTRALYCWPSFESDSPVYMNDGLLEIPMSVGRVGNLRIPFSGGIYLRVLPFLINQIMIKRRINSENPLVSYVHPYDFDPDEPHFMYPELGNSRVLNYLMYMNRHQTFNRLEKIIGFGYKTLSYREFADRKMEEKRTKHV